MCLGGDGAAAAVCAARHEAAAVPPICSAPLCTTHTWLHCAPWLPRRRRRRPILHLISKHMQGQWTYVAQRRSPVVLQGHAQHTEQNRRKRIDLSGNQCGNTSAEETVQQLSLSLNSDIIGTKT